MQKLKDSELRYRRLFEAAQDGILILDAVTGKIEDVNPFLIKMLGYSREEFLKKRLWEVGAFKDIEDSKKSFEALQANEYIRYEDLPLKTKDGRLIQVEFVSNVYLVDDERVIQCNVRDITDRKRVENALKDSEARYRRLFEAAQDGILILDAGTGMIEDVNPFLIDMLGYSREEFITKKLWEVGAFRDVEDSKRAFEALQANEYIRYEDLPLKAKDGHLIQVEFVSNVYLVGDERVIQCNIRDITVRKQAEMEAHKHLAEMEMVYENGLTLGQLLTHKAIGQNLIELIEQKMNWQHAAIRFYQPQTRSLKLMAFDQAGGEDEMQFGGVIESPDHIVFKPGDGLAGWAIQYSQIVRRGDLYNDPRYKGEQSSMRSGMYVPIQSGQSVVGVISIESEQPNAFSVADERLLTILVNQAAVAFENARLYQTAQQEIKERKRIEVLLAEEKDQLALRVEERTADLSRANLDLAYAMKVKDEFLASMSHELRTPLTGILGFAEALQLKVYGELNTAQQKIIKIIGDSGQHLLELINDILDLTKIKAEQLDLELAPCSITDICRQSLELTRGLADQKQQSVQYTPSLEPVIVRADARRLKQILVNLLGNAIKFTAERGEIGLEVEPDESNRIIKLIVWDKGIGIKPEDMPKLFIPFMQIDNRLARRHAGVGLGLSLVKRLAELHSGRIEIESRFGEGSRMTVILPWSPGESSAALFAPARDAANDAGPVISVDYPKSFTILIADDNETFLQMISDFLETDDFHVIQTHNGYDLLERAPESHADLILVDIQMPGMDGLETIRRIRAHANVWVAETPVIAVTALAMSGDRERCLNAGANEYISKPVKLLELAAIINRQLEKKISAFLRPSDAASLRPAGD